jgi:hypothetical protein
MQSTLWGAFEYMPWPGTGLVGRQSYIKIPFSAPQNIRDTMHRPEAVGDVPTS